MKKTLMTCLAIATLFAIAGSASAITCTIDQRPAATLLVPYFEVTFNPDGTPLGAGTTGRDTIVTICNASSAPMIAHYSVWSERTELVLDFNIALTGFDCQPLRVSAILTGNIPQTGFVSGGVVRDACQRNVGSGATNAKVYPNPNGFIRVNPLAPTSSLDNSLATTILPTPAWPVGSTFAFDVLDSLDETDDSTTCGGVDRVITNPIRGYITIDHANYCNLSNPGEPIYYLNDAIGMENNLFGEVIFTSGSGVPTYGNSTVNIEAATGPTPPPSLDRPFEDQTDASKREHECREESVAAECGRANFVHGLQCRNGEFGIESCDHLPHRGRECDRIARCPEDQRHTRPRFLRVRGQEFRPRRLG